MSFQPPESALSPTRSARLAVPAVLLLLALGSAAEAGAQETGWTGRLLFRALSVEDAGDWLELRQEAARTLRGGGQLRAGVSQTRRFETWDVSAEASASLRVGDRLRLSVDGRVTPGAEVLEETRLGARVSLQSGDVVPSVGYRLQHFDEGPVHTVSPRVVWYRGAWRLSGEIRVIRSALQTVNLAAIGQAARRLGSGWRARVGLAAGEEDFLVVGPSGQDLRTLTTRSAFGGVERDLPAGWSVRLDVTGVESDPTLDRFGSSLTIARAF